VLTTVALSRAPASTSPPPPTYVEPPSVRDEWEAREDLPADRAEGLAVGASPMALLLKLLSAAARARRPVPAPEPARPGFGRGVFGCLLQMVIGFFTLLIALFLFGW
jgi:hypothetical protein